MSIGTVGREVRPREEKMSNSHKSDWNKCLNIMFFRASSYLDANFRTRRDVPF